MRNESDKSNEWENEKLNPNGWLSSRPSQQFNVIRRVYQQDALNKDADYQVPDRPLGHRCKKLVNSCGIGECLLNSVPLIRWLPKYKTKEYLVGDLVAGATTAVMHIPQGMAYALLSEVPPIVGLYMAFFPVLIYVIFGTSPHISMGTFAVACLMAGKVVTQHATVLDVTHGNSTNGSTAPETGIEYTPIQVVSVVCLCVGMYQIVMWMFRLGAVSTLLSDSLVSGFTTAASFQVVASQLKDLFGVKIGKTSGNYKVVFTIVEVVKNLPNLNWAAFVISLITCVVIALNNELLKPWVSKRSRVPVPVELLAIVVGTLVSKFGGLKEQFGISLVGHIPTGLPVPQVPAVELIPQAGSKTGVTSVVSASLILCVLLWIGPFFEDLPRCVLAGIIVVSLKGMFMQMKELTKFWGLSKLDAMVWLITFLVTLIVNIDIGLGAGLLASVGALFCRSQKPYTCLLGRVLDTDLYLDTKRYRAAEELPGIKIFHYCGGLNFASKNLFRSTLFRKIGYMKPAVVTHDEDNNLTKSESYEWDPSISHKVQCVIIDATALSYVDAPGIKSLIAVQRELVSSNITVLLAGANGPVLEMIERYNNLEAERLQLDTFPTVHDAVVYYNVSEARKHDVPVTIAP
ncbi:prestin [Bombyx mandarina]|uniref:Prestin n=1 Tax=Bombyx mandarina TaxID=7092 RepID=A0A6J2JR10_BOMMA|nr:prestin [Bombyx mandarina]